MQLKSKRTYVTVGLIVVLLVSLMNSPMNAATILLNETVERTTVTKGLVYEHKQKFTKDGWIDIYVLIMDLKEEQVGLSVLRSSDLFGQRETLTSLAAEDSRVVAAMNGSFFNTTTLVSDPIGVEYDSGFVHAMEGYNMTTLGASSLIQKTDGNFNFDFLGVSFTFKNEAQKTMTIGGINHIKVNGTPMVYNALFAADSSRVDALGDYYKLVIVNDVVTEVVAPKITATIPSFETGYIVTIPTAIAPFQLANFTVGTKISLSANSTLDLATIKMAISGGGKILEKGVLVEKGLIIEPTKRHPRSAVGITADQTKLIAMVIDGRGKSIGATHAELASFLQEYKVSDAIHMDGGGSSTLLRRDVGQTAVSLANTVSDGTQRKVINGIGFVSLAEIGPVAKIQIVPSSTKTFLNTGINFNVLGFDKNENPVAISGKKLVWNMEGIQGKWDVNNFTPSTIGIGKLTAYYDGIVSTINIECVDAPISITVSPKVISLGYNEKANFSIKGIDNTGYLGAVNPKDMTYTLQNPAIGSFTDGVFTATGVSGLSKVTIKSKYSTTTAYIGVGYSNQIVPEFEKVAFSDTTYPVGNITGKISMDTTTFVDTNQSYRMDYNFKSSSDSQAYYMVMDNLTFANPIEKMSLNLYGNSGGQMFRGRIIDANNTEAILTFASTIDWTGWKSLTATVPTTLTYPIKLERLYVVGLSTDIDYTGTLYMDALSVYTGIDTKSLKFDQEDFINDSLRVKSKPADSLELKIFGPTAYRNRLLDNLLMDKVYSKLNMANYAIFAGKTDVTLENIKTGYSIWQNTYNEYKANGIKIIHLGTTEGGLRTTDYTQYDKLNKSLSTTTENAIVIIGDKNPLTSFADKDEGILVHNLLKDFAKKSGKTIMYVNAGGYKTNVTLRDGIHYFDLSGLWYKVENRRIALNETFYTLSFYMKNNQISYNLEPLYPVVEVVSK